MPAKPWSGVALLTILSFACGGQVSAPTSPSTVASSAAPATTGAVVTGDVRLGATAGIGSAADPLKVQVVGTENVATCSLAGQFTLNGVPAGQVQLHFFGAGIDAYLTLPDVAAGDQIAISVTVVGTSAAIDSESRRSSGSSEEEIEGRIESLPPTQDPMTFVVNGRTVKTTDTTMIYHGSVALTFADLEIGQRVHVKGGMQGSDFVATRIEVQNFHTDLPANVNGIVSEFRGNELDFEFKIGSRVVKGDHMTTFFGNSAFTDLKDGVRVEVKGQLQDGYTYAVRIHVNKGGGQDGGDGDDDEIELKGMVSGLSGTCPDLTFTVGTKTVTTSASTVFGRPGCSAVADGVVVEVEGILLPDGTTVQARKVEVEEFEVRGIVTGRSGTCPTISFMLEGQPWTITTDSSTYFDNGRCTDVVDGAHVEIKGMMQPGGSVLATKVEIQEYKASGIIVGLTGTCPSLTFTLQGSPQILETNGSTNFHKIRCDKLDDGDRVEVKGFWQPSGNVLVHKIEK